MRLQGARAVVTGGASRLGLAVAERFVELGARVVVLDLRPPIALPPGAAYVEADVGSEAAADRAMAEAVDVLGRLTLAVNCAGISHRGRVVGREGPMGQAEPGGSCAGRTLGRAFRITGWARASTLSDLTKNLVQFHRRN